MVVWWCDGVVIVLLALFLIGVQSKEITLHLRTDFAL